MSGSPAERVRTISQLLGKHADAAMPSALKDAHFLEEQTGDNQLGPADYADFWVLSVDAADLPAWRSACQPLEPENRAPEYAAPKKPTSWWLSEVEFRRLDFFDAKPFTGRTNGWVGISPEGIIYMHSFTM